MEHLFPYPEITKSICRKKDDMLDKERFAPGMLGILAIPVIHICKSSPGTGRHNEDGGGNTAPEKAPLQQIQHGRSRRFRTMGGMQPDNGNNRRQPDTGGKIVNKAVDNCETLFQTQAALQKERKYYD